MSNMVVYLSKFLECNIQDLGEILNDDDIMSIVENHMSDVFLWTNFLDNKNYIHFNGLTKSSNAKTQIYQSFPKKLNVENYFIENYNVVLLYPDLPLIQNAIYNDYYPMELLDAPFMCDTVNCDFKPERYNLNEFYCKSCLYPIVNMKEMRIEESRDNFEIDLENEENRNDIKLVDENCEL